MTPCSLASRILVLCLLAALVSCSGKDKDGKEKDGTDKDGKGGTDGKIDRSGLKDKKLRESFSGERKLVVLHVQMVGLNYVKSCDDHGKPPSSIKDLRNPTDDPATLERHLKDDIDIIWNVKSTLKPGGEKAAIVFERKADSDGNRAVLDGSGALRFMNDAQFQAAVKAAKE